MNNQFFERPILNSPYAYPARHWELDKDGQPTQKIIESRRSAKFFTPIPTPRKRKGKAQQKSLFAEHSLTVDGQQYCKALFEKFDHVENLLPPYSSYVFQTNWYTTREKNEHPRKTCDQLAQIDHHGLGCLNNM